MLRLALDICLIPCYARGAVVSILTGGLSERVNKFAAEGFSNTQADAGIVFPVNSQPYYEVLRPNHSIFILDRSQNHENAELSKWVQENILLPA